MSEFRLNEAAAPTTPTAGLATLYEDTVGNPRLVNSKGVNVSLANVSAYNWIRNSGFWFAQRQPPGTATSYSFTGNERKICADGWGIAVPNNNPCTYQRIDTIAAVESGLAGRYYGKFVKTIVAGKIGVSQVIESSDTQAIRGKTVRVQFWAKAVTTNSTWRFGTAVVLGAANRDIVSKSLFYGAENAVGVDPTFSGSVVTYNIPRSDRTPDNGTVSGNGVTISLTTAWQRFGAVFNIPIGAVNVIPMVWSNDQVAVGNGIAIAQFSLNDGEAIVDWEPTSLNRELSRVQRYYAKSFPIDTAPAQSAGLAGAIRGHVSVAGAIASQPIGVRFPVVLRSAANATFVFYNPSAANAFARNTTAGTDATATAVSGGTPGDPAFDAIFTGIAAWTVAQSVAVHYSADNEL